MVQQEIITTRIFRSTREFIKQREMRIEEAMAFVRGTIAKPNKHLIPTLPNQKEAHFFKPWKETLRVNPNIHDIFPNVGKDNISETDSWTFDKIWEYLIKISIIIQLTFKKVLVLLYRICFLIDHKEISLLEYLHFIGLLSWNEDVKYHITDNKPDFKTRNAKVGRVNTILTVISAPLLISSFIQDIIYKTETKSVIDVKLITQTIQIFSKTRGICVLSHTELQKYLNPYLQNGDTK